VCIPAVARLIEGAADLVGARGEGPGPSGPSPLAPYLREGIGPAALLEGRLRPWLELSAHSYLAGGGSTQHRQNRRCIEIVLGAFAMTVWAIEVLDDLVDGDQPESGCQAPNLALYLIGDGHRLLFTLPPRAASQLHAYWSDQWVRWASAQAQDVAIASGEKGGGAAGALTVAEGCGLVTRWGAEAAAIAAGATLGVRDALARFGQHLGTAEKILHDLNDVWPGPTFCRDLGRSTAQMGTSLPLALALDAGLLAGGCVHDPRVALVTEEARLLLLQRGVLHHAWAYADHYRLLAAQALHDLERVGGDAAMLEPLLNLPTDLRALDVQDP